MRLTLSLLLLSFYITADAQKTLAYADSIRITYKIPEISYAVADAASTLEMAALGRHSVSLPDKATLHDRFHIGSNTKAMTAFMIAKYVERILLYDKAAQKIEGITIEKLKESGFA